jgi:hypothetical protein
MKKLNNFRIPLLLALFMGLFLGTWAQQEIVASDGAPQNEMEAKKDLYRQLGVEWKYQDGASLDAAREQMARSQNSPSREVSTDPEYAKKQMMVEYMANKAEWINTNPEKFEQYHKALSGDGVSEISQEEYNNFPAEKKAHVDANPSMYRISKISTH